MTTSDIESATIYLRFKNGDIAVASVKDNPFLFAVIAETAKFVKFDSDKVVEMTIGELLNNG